MSARRIALVIMVAVAAVISVTNCSSLKSSSSPSSTPTPSPTLTPTPTPTGTSQPPPATKPDGSPSNLACNGTNNDPAATTSSVTMTLLTLSEPLSGTPPPLGGVRIAEYTLATGTTAGGAAVTTSSGVTNVGFAKESLTANKRWAFALTAPASAPEPYIPTYQFNVLTPPTGTMGTAAVITFLDIPSVIYGAFTGFLGVTSLVTGDMQVAGTIVDCDGAPVANAVVAALPNCTAKNVPCAGYFISGAPNSSGVHTDTSGQFVVAGVLPGSRYGIDVEAVLTAGTQPVKIGHFSVFGQPNSVGLATVQPLGTSTSGN